MTTLEQKAFEQYGEQLQATDDDELLTKYHFLNKQVAWSKGLLGRCEQEMLRRRAERSTEEFTVTGIPSETFVCEFTRKDGYSQPMFTPLKEHLTDTDLAKVFTPAHDETIRVEDAWDTNKLKAVCKKTSTEAQRLFDAAKIPGPWKLTKFARREEK